MNICRPIILHNEFLPAKTDERAWQYRAFGHYDGITVKESISIEKYENMKSLFDFCLKSEEESFSYFSQILLGFHTKTESEEGFWRRKLPFMYLVLLQTVDTQILKYQKYLESEEFLQKELSRMGRQNEMKDTLIAAYYSLDNSDLIVAIKCGYADTGAALINSLHHLDESKENSYILNSYSILGICSEEIEKPEHGIEGNRLIDRMELRIIEGDYNSVAALYDRLKEELQVSQNGIDISLNTLLGTEDCLIIIEHLPWKLLLPLYREKTGILNNSNRQAQDYAYAISTKIITPLNEEVKGKEKNGKNFETGEGQFCFWLNEKINDVYKEKRNVGYSSEKKNLSMFAKSLSRFEHAHYLNKEFSDYNFFALYLPFYIFVKLLGEGKGGCTEDYYDFMKGLRLRTQSFTKSDRVFSQIADFNMRYFDIPVKLITLYSAYIYYFKRALNTKKNKNYEFLLCSGMNSQIGVIELFPMISQENRLFLIEIPEQHMYNLKQTFIMIGHEVAHFVGTDVRSRSERMEHMIKVCARIVALSMKCYLGWQDEFVLNNEDVLDFAGLEEKLCEWIDFYIHRELNIEYLQNIKYHSSITPDKAEDNYEYKKKYYKHLDVFRENILSYVEEMLLTHGQDLFGYISYREYYKNDELIGCEDREGFLAEKSDKLQEYINQFIRRTDPKNQILTISNAINDVIYLVRECYADMICILTLRLSLKDYLEAILEIIRESNIPVDDLRDTNLIARIAIVMSVIGHSLEQEKKPEEGISLFRWTNKEFDYLADAECEIRKLEDAANTFACDYIQGEVTIRPDKIIFKSVGIIYDRQILREIITYLLKCRKKYFKKLIESKQESVQYVQNIYSLSKKQESGEFFADLMDMIANYEADVYENMQEIVKLDKKA